MHNYITIIVLFAEKFAFHYHCILVWNDKIEEWIS